MQRYSEWAPTGFDARGLGVADMQDWLVVPVILTRDSGIVTTANFTAAQEAFIRGVGADSEDWDVCRFNHWGPGWFRIILARPDSQAARIAEDIETSLASYAVLDEALFSRLEYEHVTETWSRMSVRERVDALRYARLSIFAARRDELPEDPAGLLWERLAREC